mmetsp:Transcript_1166/g.4366  ORF Transcript_1166/g.4366 Transcript_1166/m.4366 type:complete len:126 (+) Transcript_1166:882-1259(+)
MRSRLGCALSFFFQCGKTDEYDFAQAGTIRPAQALECMADPDSFDGGGSGGSDGRGDGCGSGERCVAADPACFRRRRARTLIDEDPFLGICARDCGWRRVCLAGAARCVPSSAASSALWEISNAC